MNLLIWMDLGLIAGMVANKSSRNKASTLTLDPMLGVTGAIAGGLAFSSFLFPQAPSLVASSSVAAVGSVATLAGYRTIFRRV